MRFGTRKRAIPVQPRTILTRHAPSLAHAMVSPDKSVYHRFGKLAGDQVRELPPIEHPRESWARGSADEVRDDRVRDVIEYLGHEDDVLVIDETEFLKRRTHSAGVARMSSGTTGRIENGNGQVGVFLASATPRNHTLIDRKRSLPPTWAGDGHSRPGEMSGLGVADRRSKAGPQYLQTKKIGDLIPLTVPEVRAFLVAVLWQRAFTPETVLTFSKCGHRPLNSQTPPTLKPEAHPGKSGAVVSGTGSPCEPGTAEIGS